MKIATVCSVYGGYDTPAEIMEQTVPFTQILVTDTPTPSFRRQVVVEPRPHLHPRMAAKYAKLFPWHYAEADVYVWTDGSAYVKSPEWLEWLLSLSAMAPVTQFMHFERDDVMDEAHASVGMLKYDGMPVLEQAQHYLDQGHPRNWGLWETGTIVYRPGVYVGNAAMDMLNEANSAWLREMVRWTWQDQVSQPFVYRNAGLRPRSIDGNMRYNDYMGLHMHHRED